MKILLVGGAGHVGTCTTPYLKRHHDLRVLDIAKPRHEVEYIEGSIADPEALACALDGVDAFINLTMKSGQGGLDSHQTEAQIVDNYTVNCLGLHLLLYTAWRLGVKRGVHTSTMSVHYRARSYYPSEEEAPLDGPNVYGFTKGLAEGICRYFARQFDMNLAVLRITGPRSRAQFLAQAKNPPHYPPGSLYFTDEEDLAKAYLAALDYVSTGHGRCDVFFISGDADHREMNMSKARTVLGWEPKSHLMLEE